MLTIKNRLATHRVMIFAAIGLAFFSAGCKPPGARALLKGKQLLAEGKTADAIEQLKTATTLLSTNAHAWNYLGLANHAAGQPAEAALDYEKALTLNPNLVEAHYNFGCLLLEQNNFPAAKNELTAYTLSRPRDLNGWMHLGSAQWHGRDSAGAERSYSEALRLNPQIPEAWNALGLIQMQRGRALDASKDFTAAVQLQGDYAPALLNLAIVEQQYLGNRREALNLYQSYLAVKSAPNKDSVAALARALDQELNPPPAVVIAKVTPPPAPVTRPEPPVAAPATPAPPLRPAPVVAKPAAPVAPPARVVTPPPATPAPVVVAVAPNNPAPAEPLAPATSSTEPKRSWPEVTPLPPDPGAKVIPPPETVVVSNLPPVVAPPPPKPKPKPIARYAYHSPAKPRPGSRALAENPFALGLDEQQQNHLPEAAQAFRAATAADPAFFKAYYNLAWTSYALKDWPAALEAYESALAIDPESPDARYNFALTLKQAGYPLDAVNELEKLLPKRSDDAAVHLLLANLYAQQLGAPQMARPHYLAVLQLEPNHPQAAQIRYWLAGNPEKSP